MEKLNLKDDYDLINSKSIADYCRKIKHKFNTEELAVLVYRNQRMSIDEKIEKYNDLIKNYPDMEVIERINCKHYDSVKILIKDEIKRLKSLYSNMIQDDGNSICVWTEYNKSTQKISHYKDLDNMFKTFNEAYRDIQEYVDEYDDTIAFYIIKRYFDPMLKDIIAYYIVEDKKIKLIDVCNHGLVDIDQIYLNIPTPFKEGDILINKSSPFNSYGIEESLFVLDYMSTWRDGLDKLLKEENYDSSDMVGYGYFFRDEDSTEFIMDHQFNYDCFEFYDGELTGRYRILKAISSFIKKKITLELFIHAYDYFKNDYKNMMPKWFTEERLRMAGLSEEEAEKYKG